MGVSMIDLFSGVMMALATVSALRRASETGVGDDVDVSLFDVGLYSLNYLAHWYLNGGAETRRLPRSAHASLTPCQLYRTADGWIYLMCNKEKFWPALCSRIGRPDWASEPRYATFADRLKCRDELTQMLDRQLSGRTTSEWLEIFGDAVPAAPLRSLAQALDGAEVAQRGAVEVVPAPGADPLRLLGFPVRAATAGTRSGLAPALGEHTDALLAGLGLTPADIRRLRADGVV
jgi:crotonobetainyl-CoA:carnitine CoA-transferase CaiB-like acyl-CoA transferase